MSRSTASRTPSACEPAAAIAAQLAKAQASTTAPGLIRDVFLLESQGPRAGVLQRFDPASRHAAAGGLAGAARELARFARRTSCRSAPAAGILPIFLADAVDAAAPALIIPVPFVKRIGLDHETATGASRCCPIPRARRAPSSSGSMPTGCAGNCSSRWSRSTSAPATRRSTSSPIVQREPPSRVIYASATDAAVDERAADVSAGMFDLRMNEVTRLTGTAPPSAAAGYDAVAPIVSP